jgi:hypothetical protein
LEKATRICTITWMSWRRRICSLWYLGSQIGQLAVRVEEGDMRQQMLGSLQIFIWLSQKDPQFSLSLSIHFKLCLKTNNLLNTFQFVVWESATQMYYNVIACFWSGRVETTKSLISYVDFFISPFSL